MNKTLLRKIATAIEANPRRHNQGCWDSRQMNATASTTRVRDVEDCLLCDTVGCVAGWAVFLTPKEKRPRGDFRKAAKKLLRLNEHQCDVLFSPDWNFASDLTVPEALREIARTGVVK